MPLIGIDLGTTFSAVGYLDPSGTPATIPNAEGELTTPSAILFEPTGEIIVGREARRAALTEPTRVADYVKRCMGDPVYPRIISGRRMSPTELSSLILKKLRQDAEKRVGTIAGAVITVPAYFDEARRQATALAGKMAGLNVIDIINEPTAAALAYAYQTMSAGGTPRPGEVRKELAAGKVQTILVYDLGGGTFDVTVLAINGGELRVVSTTGDVQLGGRDWDERLFNFAADAFVHAYSDDPRDNPASYQGLMLAAEETKKILSQRRQTKIAVTHAGQTLAVEVTREQFEQLSADLLYRTESRLRRVLKMSSLSWDKIDQVLAVGGSTRMPQVLEMLRRVTGKDANCSLSPDEAVAHGAAIHAAVTTVGAGAAAAAAAPLPKVVPLSPPPIPKPAPITTAVPIADDQPVAPPVSVIGYFKQRALELLRSIRTINVNAHSLGVIVTQQDGRERVSVVVPNDTPLPVSVTKTFGTIMPNQKVVTVRVVEGESRDPGECIPVGSCQIKQLPLSLPRNSPIEVTFTYDNSCRLHVKARHVTSGSWASAMIERRQGIPAAPAEPAAAIPISPVEQTKPRPA